MTDKAKTLSDEEIRAVWSKAYEGQDFMVLLPEGTLPATGNIIGSNAAHLQVVTDRKAGPHSTLLPPSTTSTVVPPDKRSNH